MDGIENSKYGSLALTSFLSIAEFPRPSPFFQAREDSNNQHNFRLEKEFLYVKSEISIIISLNIEISDDL